MKAVDKLTSAEAERTRPAGEDIAGHDRRYHGEDAPSISDADYDALRQRNAAIETRFPLLVRPTVPATGLAPRSAKKFAKVLHPCRCCPGQWFSDETWRISWAGCAALGLKRGRLPSPPNPRLTGFPQPAL